MPRSGENAALRTWHFPHGRLYSLRAFELSSGETRLVRADSCWVLVDLARRKPVHIEKVLPSLFQEGNPPIPFEFGKVEACTEGPWSARLRVKDGDIDDNGHVNHVRYLEWAVETLPGPWREGKAFRGFDAEFHGEGRVGEELEIFAKPGVSRTGEAAFLHGIHRPSDGAELFRMRTVWE
jgi:acyl-ACP thioesterase